LWTDEPEARTPREITVDPAGLPAGEIAKSSAVVVPPTSEIVISSASVDAPSVFSLMQSWLVLKALTMKRGPVSLVAGLQDAYEGQVVVGQGSFGKVVRARCKASGQLVCLKEQLASDFDDFLHELVLLSRLQHDNIVAVLDVFVLPVPTLVLADAGCDLATVIKAGPCPLVAGPTLMPQLLSGLKCLHDHLVIHSDLKPRNICVDSQGRLRIIDLGCGVVSLAGFRSERSASDVVAAGLVYCTLFYRAPEVLLGDVGFSFPVDMWAAGCCWAEMVLGKPLFASELSQIGMIISIFRLVGSPGIAELPWFEALPLWSRQFPSFGPRTVADIFAGSLPPAMSAQLCMLLIAFPRHRLTAADAVVRWQLMSELASPSPLPIAGQVMGASPNLLSLQDKVVNVVCASQDLLLKLVTDHGRKLFVGKRGSFNLLEGGLSTPVLEWLRGDPVFSQSAGDAGWIQQKRKKGAQAPWKEHGKKLELIGHLRTNSRRVAGLTLNGVDASHPLFPRMRAWAAAFRLLNADSFRQVQTKIRANLRKLPAESLSINGRFFLLRKLSTGFRTLVRCS
jgi:serine/threonine protein kinase